MTATEATKNPEAHILNLQTETSWNLLKNPFNLFIKQKRLADWIRQPFFILARPKIKL
jgi:hypothetical protein